MKQAYVHRDFRAPALGVIKQANDIIDSYKRLGIVLTLRQLYYQFVAAALIPNTDRSYKRLGSIVSDARLAGLIDWNAIEDRLREPVVWAEYASAEAMVQDKLPSFRKRRLEGQEVYVELWVEKDALASVLEPIAADYHVTLMVNRGYSSSSAMKASADRIVHKTELYGSSSAHILYLGDLDPSGEDMVRDIRDRLDLFTCGMATEGDLVVEKLALTIEQVRKHSPPPNPAKLSDSRAASFIAKYGHQSWEVDALSPPVLRQLICDALEEVIDMTIVADIIEEEECERERVRSHLDY